MILNILKKIVMFVFNLMAFAVLLTAVLTQMTYPLIGAAAGATGLLSPTATAVAVVVASCLSAATITPMVQEWWRQIATNPNWLFPLKTDLA